MAYDIHIKFDGGDVTIQGASMHKGHKNEVPLIAWSWGMSNTGNLHTGDGYASGGKADIQDITITKFVDGVSNAIIAALVKGARAEKATISVANATGEQTDFLEVELSKGVLFTSYSTGCTEGDERMTETITLHFGAFEYKFKGQTEKGKEKGDKTAKYDMREVYGTAG